MRRALILVALTSLLAPAPAVAARRSVVALVGDSIVESAHLAEPRTGGLAPALRHSLRRLGFDPGGEGFIAPHPVELSVVVGARPSAGGGWTYRGGWVWITAADRPATASLFSWTLDPAATASLQARVDTATLVYLTGPTFGRFWFEAGGLRSVVDARAPRPGTATRTVRLPPVRGSRVISVGEVRDGGLGLAGAFLRRDLRPGREQVEVSALGATGALGGEPETPLMKAGLSALAPRVTVLVLGTNDAIVAASTGDRRVYPRLERGVLARARQARRSGACVVVPPGRARLPRDVFERVRAAERRAARRAGCAYAPVLDVLDADRGLTVDGVHPRETGYERVARALARVVASQLGPV